MNEKQKKKHFKFLSLVLRHSPEKINLNIDHAGWAKTEELLKCLANHNPLTLEQLKEITESNDKKRFEFSKDGKKFRASQGHSIDVKLDYKSVEPPKVLYHGTVGKFIDLIFKEGLSKQKRHHVHLSKDVQTASKVGLRRGKPIILEVDAEQMYKDGHIFYVSANGVWLTDNVPSKYLTINKVWKNKQ